MTPDPGETDAADGQSEPEDGAANGHETDGGAVPAGSESVDGGNGPVDGHDAPGDGRDADTTGDFGWRGWVLVGALVVSLLVIPWSIIALPRAQGFLASLGLGWRDAYLFLPMVPAVGLGTLAVWAAVASRRSE